jgi:hypothetical protein
MATVETVLETAKKKVAVVSERDGLLAGVLPEKWEHLV